MNAKRNVGLHLQSEGKQWQHRETRMQGFKTKTTELYGHMDKSSSGRLDHCFRAINHYSTWCFCGHQSTAQQVPMQHRAQINKTKDDLQNLAAKLHEVELVINAREDLRDGRGVGDHTARTHDLGQVTPRYNGWRLIVDAALEASWAPVHELNGTLGLDRGHGSVHILWHHISLPHAGCRLLPTNMYVIHLHTLVPAGKEATTGMTEPKGRKIIIQNLSSCKLSENESYSLL